MIWNSDSLALSPGYARMFDVMITDPPYREYVHANATSQSAGRGTRKRDLGFVSLSRRARRATAAWARDVKRWSVVYSDVEDSTLLRWAVQAHGVEYVRTMPWVRWSMPQLSGDRPPQGFEHVCCFHPKGKKRWNGPGNLTHLAHLALRGEEKHKCEKPLDQALDLVSFFTEIDPSWASRAGQRLTGAITPRDLERIRRWLDTDSEPVSSLTEGPSVARAQSRAFDKANVRGGVFL